MKTDVYKDLSPEVKEKAKKNLVYVSIFSIIMLFAGFTSAYIVSMGDSFWLKYPLPTSFWISTAFILLSSIFLQLAIVSVKKGAIGQLKLHISLTLLTGIAFAYFQFEGYKDLTKMGAHAVNNHIIVTDGRYGDYYEVKYKGVFLEVDGNHYVYAGKSMNEQQMKAYQDFMGQFVNLKQNTSFNVTNYGKSFILYYNNQPLGLINGKLCKPDGTEIQYVDQLRLKDLAINVRDGRVDFFNKGELGKDFQIYFKGKALTYQERSLYFEGKRLSKYLQIKAMETADSATSYFYIITFLHLLHILGTLIYLIKMVIGSFSGRFNKEEHLSLRLGAIFWHFLGLLWVYLLLFLIFIH